MYLFIVGWLIFTNVLLIEGRVFCQDVHASPWVPLGYTCPVMCQNIMNAIEKLKVIDYKKVLDDNRRQRVKMNHSFINSIKNQVNISFDKKKEKSHIPWKQTYVHKSLRYRDVNNFNNNEIEEKNKFLNVYRDINIGNNIIEFPNEKYKKAPKLEDHQPAVNTLTYSRQIKNEYKTIGISGFHSDFDIELKKVFENRTCDWFKSKQPYILIKKIIKKCNRDYRRKGYGEDFLRTLTRTMNRFSKVSFEFTEDMVELVLERVFGKNVELRDNIFDVDKLLRYLRNAMAHYDKHEERESTIVLKPRHCLPVSVPGCFCRPGFVESSGQCVKPIDCITESSNEIYLARIIVH